MKKLHSSPAQFLGKIKSVAAAISVLLGSKNGYADTNILANFEGLNSNRLTVDPLILTPASAVLISDQLFAAHRSHRSHSSHRSHYSSSVGGYYSAPLSSAPVAEPKVSVIDAANPTSNNSVISRVELTNGATIFGTVLVKSSTGIGIKMANGKYYKIPRILISQPSILSLGLPL
jgi:hypothetical protein